MKRLTFLHAVLATCLVGAPALVTACSSAPGGTENSSVAESGVISLPLTTVANNHLYRLRNAFIDVFGPSYASLRSSDDPSETALSATLQTGSYAAYLSFGWTLERDDGTGVFTPVQATLVSSSVVNFAIYNGTTTTISYRFETDGVVVTVGAGDLKVTVGVHEIGAVCTPFAADCVAGTWCPPTGLTGAARACVPEGAVVVGQPCVAPVDCVANASCFDLGDGPVCAELCPMSRAGADCDSGGVCQPAGVDYGVCRTATVVAR